jgi:hypothetical protein
MIEQQPKSQPTTAGSPLAVPVKSGMLKLFLIILSVWQILLLIFLLLASLQINQLSTDLATAKQQYNLLVHFKQIPK